eukprot:gene9253-biopygen15073
MICISIRPSVFPSTTELVGHHGSVVLNTVEPFDASSSVHHAAAELPSVLISEGTDECTIAMELILLAERSPPNLVIVQLTFARQAVSNTGYCQDKVKRDGCGDRLIKNQWYPCHASYLR